MSKSIIYIFLEENKIVIKDYLIKSNAVNDLIPREQISELRQLVGMLGRTILSQPW